MAGKITSVYHFRILVCGSKGGSYGGDSSSYLIASKNEPFNFIAMDGGTQLDCLPEVLAIDAKNKKLKLLDTVEQRKVNKPLIDAVTAAESAVEDATEAAKPEKERLLQKAKAQAAFKSRGAVGWFKQKQINGFLITHAHLDHTAGLVIASAEDDFLITKKPVIGLKGTIDGINEQFKQPLWPGNFFYAIGESTALKPEETERMKGIYPERFKASGIEITAYSLNHGNGKPATHIRPEESTAFLICDKFKKRGRRGEFEESCVLYLGDTGADRVEDKDWDGSTSGLGKLRNVWDKVYDLIKDGRLRTIFLECSFVNGKADNELFGHLTPQLIGEELQYIGQKLYEETSGSGIRSKTTARVSVVVTHIKPTWNIPEGAEETTQQQSIEYTIAEIEKQLEAENIPSKLKNLGVSFIIPRQGDMIYTKARDKTIHVPFTSLKTGNAMPLDVPHAPHVHHKHHVRHSRPVYDDYFDALHGVNDYDSSRWIMAEEGVAYVALLAFVITICFILGLVCGAGYEEVKSRITKRAKQDK